MDMTYTEPVSKLLKLGRPDGPWLEYPALGITRESVPELIRLVQDDELRLMARPDSLPEGEDVPEWYAQVHAWRALAQLRAEEAIPALLGILHQIDDDNDDWLASDAEEVFSLLGMPAVEPLAAYLSKESNPMYARSAAASALAEIGRLHPQARERCIQAIAAVLENHESNDEGLNGFLIGDLVKLNAVEQIDLIRRAFAAEAVDESIYGDVEDVQIQLGLLKERLTPERPWRFLPSELDLEEPMDAPKRLDLRQKKEKNKRKQEKKSRKRNRRKR
jgi:HEAT repeat protein